MSAVPATGLTRCFDAAGGERPCPGTGEDAERFTSAAFPTPRFSDYGQTVCDELTGLCWTKDAAPLEFPLNWEEALGGVAQLNAQGFAGHSDWRLPNRRELRSLVCHDSHRPALPRRHPFSNLFQGWYWSSTTAAVHPAHAWYVDMAGGRMFYGGKDQAFMVWPVRGEATAALLRTGQQRCFDAAGEEVDCRGAGQDASYRMGRQWPAHRFRTTADGVLDLATTLLWHPRPGLGLEPVDWQRALEIVAAMDERGAGWRLPDINELESLVDCERAAPALAQGHPFAPTGDVFWSSTTSVYEPDWAWALYLDKGAVGVGQKREGRFSIWPVRTALPRDVQGAAALDGPE